MTAPGTRYILICSGKGGVGKTTLTANLGIALARQGVRTAVLDADFGLRNLDLLLGLENRIVFTAQEVLSGSCRLEQALVKHKQEPNLALLPAGNPRMLEWLQPEDMQRIATMLGEQFDVVLIDCPAGIEQGFKNSIAGADRAIIVTNPEVSAIRDADRVIGLIEANELPEPKLIINRYRPGMVSRGEMMSRQDILEILAIPLLGIVPEHEDVVVSTNRGNPAAFDDNSPVGQAYRRIAARVQGQDVAIPNFDADKTFWSTFMRWMGINPAQEVA